jgi:hypothetical protein
MMAQSLKGVLNIIAASHHVGKRSTQEQGPTLTSRGAKLRSVAKTKKARVQGESSKRTPHVTSEAQQKQANKDEGQAPVPVVESEGRSSPTAGLTCITKNPKRFFQVTVSEAQLSALTTRCGINLLDVVNTHQELEAVCMMDQINAAQHEQAGRDDEDEDMINCQFDPDPESSDDEEENAEL